MVERYRHLVKARTKALDVFERAKADLIRLDGTIEKEQASCADAVERLKAMIVNEQEALSYLKAEQARTRETIGKIAAVTT
jgi:septal ring factor EnvC (AmiA/AmiB activator)